jgi:hypothetical protein
MVLPIDDQGIGPDTGGVDEIIGFVKH